MAKRLKRKISRTEIVQEAAKAAVLVFEHLTDQRVTDEQKSKLVESLDDILPDRVTTGLWLNMDSGSAGKHTETKMPTTPRELTPKRKNHPGAC